TQMENYLAEIFGLGQGSDNTTEAAMEETRRAVERIMAGQSHAVQLNPQEPAIRRMQHEMAREANLLSRSSGTEPHRRVTIYGS
ncbi:MAG: AAA family ATPase, partial [Chloroflexi bacterium]|nr:AAA family ATPase [Chloroflexota bacterium]